MLNDLFFPSDIAFWGPHCVLFYILYLLRGGFFLERAKRTSSITAN